MGLADRDYMKSERWQREQRQRLAEWHWQKLPKPWPTASRGQRLARYAIIAILALVPGAAIGYAAGAELGPFASSEPVLVWGGERFSSKAAFEVWLTARGRSYESWAAKHPAAAE